MVNLHEEVAMLQAQLTVQHMALRALVYSHPQPAALLQQWRTLRANRVAAAYGLRSDVRGSDWLSQQAHAFAEDWTAELVEAVTRHADGMAVSPSDPDVA